MGRTEGGGREAEKRNGARRKADSPLTLVETTGGRRSLSILSLPVLKRGSRFVHLKGGGTTLNGL